MNDNKTNLLIETLQTLAYNGKTTQDVKWVGSKDGEYSIDWDSFAIIAGDTNYDSGFGTVYVNSDLVIVGSDWWLERYEYDGSEWWEFKKLPSMKIPALSFNNVISLISFLKKKWNK